MAASGTLAASSSTPFLLKTSICKKTKTNSNMEDPVRLDCLQKSKHTVHLRWETTSGNDFAVGRKS